MGDQAGRGIHRAIGMVEPKQAMRMSWLADLLREQRATGFADFAGARASATIPISDLLATRLIARRLPPSSAVREIELRAAAGNMVTVAVRLAKPAFLPRFEIPIHIYQQPLLPEQSMFAVRSALLRGLAARPGPPARDAAAPFS